MLATSDLWFRYQDEPVLKGLNLDFRFRLLPVWWARTAVGSLRFYEPERPVASAKGAVLWQENRWITASADYWRCASKLRRFFRTLNSRFLY